MIAISSPKPHSKSAEVASNQIAAKESWDKVFSKIFYLASEDEPDLHSPKTTIFPGYDFPHIFDLVEWATGQPEWVCLINADIIVDIAMLQVEQELIQFKAQSAMSRRWQLPDNRVVDMGLDWFAATPEIWAKILPHVPPQFRIGNILWDTWMLNAFTSIGDPKRSYDVTACRVIYHPKHGDRHYPYDIKAPEELNRSKIIWPRPLIMRRALQLTKPYETDGNICH